MLLCACTQPCSEHSYGDWITEGEEIYRVCTICEEKELHTHTYGQWEFTATKMSRVCEECESKERVDIDRKLAIPSLLKGHWDFDTAIINEKTIRGYDLEEQEIGHYLSLREDGTGVYWDTKTEQSVTWTFLSYGDDVYQCTLTLADGKQLDMALNQAKSLLAIIIDDHHYVYLSKFEDMTPYLTGSYYTVKDNILSYVTLSEDHTFAGDVNGPVHGTWYLRPMKTWDDGSVHIDLLFCVEQNGSTQITHNTFGFFSRSDFINQDSLTTFPLQFENIDGKRLNYQLYKHITAEELEAVKQLKHDALQALKTVWYSTYALTWNDHNDENMHTKLAGFSITFEADGTFTSQFDTAMSGTWTLEEFSTPNPDTPRIAEFLLKFSNGREADCYITLYDAATELSIVMKEHDRKHNLLFLPLTEEERAVLDQPISGNWKSVSVFSVDTNTWETISEDVKTDAYSLTVKEDGTFEAVLERAEQGTWEYHYYSHMSFSSSDNKYHPDNTHNYDFRYTGATDDQRVELSIDGTLTVQYDLDHIRYIYTMERQP